MPFHITRSIENFLLYLPKELTNLGAFQQNNKNSRSSS